MTGPGSLHPPPCYLCHAPGAQGRCSAQGGSNSAPNLWTLCPESHDGSLRRVPIICPSPDLREHANFHSALSSTGRSSSQHQHCLTPLVTSCHRCNHCPLLSALMSLCPHWCNVAPALPGSQLSTRAGSGQVWQPGRQRLTPSLHLTPVSASGSLGPLVLTCPDVLVSL